LKISILIPFYNVSSFIDRSLSSALNQTYADLEFILVNDGSTDDSLSIAKRVIQNHFRKESVIIINHQTNQGIASARNTCINNATGDYIFFLDSDDELPLNSIENLTESNIESIADLTLGEFNVVGGKRDNYVKIKIENEIRGKENVFDSFISNNWYDGTCNKLVRRNFLNENNISFHKNIVHEDILWSFEIAMKANLIIYCPNITYIYHLRSNSITQKMSEKNFYSLMFIMRKMVEYDSLYELHKYHHRLFDYFSNLRIYLLKNVIRFYKEKTTIKKIINEVNLIFYSKEYNKISNYSISSFFKIIPYKLPFLLSVLYIKLVCIKR
jgi:glycosyltransferase involved in cell wall biosynthesis